VSPLEEFAHEKFIPVNADWDQGIRPQDVKRVVFCSGKVFFDLMAARKERGVKDIRDRAHCPTLSLPGRAVPAADQPLQEREGSRLVPGRAGEPGRVVLDPALHLAAHARGADPRLRDAPVVGFAAAGYASLHNEQQKQLVEAAFGPLTDNLVKPVQGTGRKA